MGSKWITKATHLPELYSLESTISVTAFIGSHPMQNNMRVERQETGHDSKNKMKVSFAWIQLLEIIIIIIIIIIIFLEMASRVNEEITSLTLQRKLHLTFL